MQALDDWIRDNKASECYFVYDERGFSLDEFTHRFAGRHDKAIIV
jgi:hypothetical protein